MIAPFAMSCAENAGAGKFAMRQWDGTRLQRVSDWQEPLDPGFIRTMIEDSAARFAAENGITPRDYS